jgi:hypothetical protein
MTTKIKPDDYKAMPTPKEQKTMFDVPQDKRVTIVEENQHSGTRTIFSHIVSDVSVSRRK